MTTKAMHQEIGSLFQEWNAALATGEPAQVAALYAPNAILLPTVSNQVRHNHPEIEDYFKNFLLKGPQGVIDESNVRTYGNVAINSGVYTFTLAKENNAKVQARFTFTYRWNGQKWEIIEHHSSAMPEGNTLQQGEDTGLDYKADSDDDCDRLAPVAAASGAEAEEEDAASPVAPEDIGSLFQDWNAALATGEPAKVAALYAPDAILLPTVSNQVRHNHPEIEDYFKNFLLKGPQGVIDESNVRTYGDVAINSGVYTFTLRNENNAKVQARFTFAYRWNGQKWEIIEHHSSAMPEGNTL